MHRRNPSPLVAVVATVLLGGCSLGPSGNWQAPYGRHQALVGKIVRVEDSRPVSIDEVAAAMRRADVVLIGEQHDNPDHHRLQARLLRAMVDAGRRRPALVFEMLDEGDRNALERWRAEGGDADRLAELVEWNDSGWPDWALYRPVFEAACGAGLPIVVGNLSRGRLAALAGAPGAADTHGSSSRAAVSANAGAGAAWPAVESGTAAEPGKATEQATVGGPGSGSERLARTLESRAAAALALRLPAAQQAAAEEEVVASHCGHAPPGFVDYMLRAQRLRDAYMAAVLYRAGAARGAVLVAGNGHVRNDRGVAWHLGLADDRLTVVSIGLLEVVDGFDKLSDYDVLLHPAEGAEGLPFDYVWFTPRQNDEDPCERFAGVLEKMQQRR